MYLNLRKYKRKQLFLWERVAVLKLRSVQA